MNQFCRADVLRILHISANQLAGWQRAGLVPISDDVSPSSTCCRLKKVRDLRAKRVRPAVIRESLQAMQKQVAGMENPLLEASAFSVGSRVAYRHEGHSRGADCRSVRHGLCAGRDRRLHRQGQADCEVRDRLPTCSPTASPWKNIPAPTTKPSKPTCGCWSSSRTTPPAHINLGTLYYNRQDFVVCREALPSGRSGRPALCAGLLRSGQCPGRNRPHREAVAAYKTAIQLAPTYADAHYNLALAYERLRQPRQALPHWKTYLKLDSSGPWAVHARNQVARILEADKLKIVYKRP